MNASTARLEKRIAELEEQVNDTPERRAAQRAKAEEKTYTARLERSLNRIRKDLPDLAVHLRSRLAVEVEQGQRHLDLLRREKRTVQYQMAAASLAELPRTIATEILSPRFPSPPIYHDVRASNDEVEAARIRRQHLDQHRQDHLEQAVSELLEAAEVEA